MTFDFRRSMTSLAGAAALTVLSSTAFAAPLLFATVPGATVYGDLVMTPNDDGSSSRLDLPFSMNFFGTTYDSFWVNNNGNITFTGPLSEFTPEPFPSSGLPMIAPFWGDVDTRGVGEVSVGTLNADTFIVTWDQVGYFNRRTDLRNSFQLVVRNKAGETGNAGDFDVEFRYEDLQWTAGGASGGEDGIWIGPDGAPAQAGYDAGDGTNFFTLPFSRTNDIVQLKNNTNVPAGGIAGLWAFAIRSGALPGSSPSNPLLPIIRDGSFIFDFNIDLNERISIDPPVAVGYNYKVEAGPGNFASVQLDSVLGDGVYSLWADLDFNGLIDEVGELLTDSLSAGVDFLFPAGGVNFFRVGAIELDAMVDPLNPLALVTTLTFTEAGTYQVSQTPIVEESDPGSSSGGSSSGGSSSGGSSSGGSSSGGPVPTPSPATLSLFGFGALALAGVARRRRRK